MPIEIGLRHFEHRRQTLRACALLRDAYLRKKQDLVLDFRRTTTIKPEGMLLLVAEIDRAIRMGSGDQQVDCRLPAGDDHPARIVRQVLEQIGLLHRIGVGPAPTKNTDREYDETVRHWRYATGTRVDEQPGDVLELHEGRISPGLMKGMQVGLAEALLNSLHHAYKGDRNDGCAVYNERRWWMFTHERDGMLNVLVCDLGIGIPRSLPMEWDRSFLKRLRSLLVGMPPHVAAIRMALVLGESSTGDEHRGKGLPQIWNATAASNAGGVGILSGRAYVGLNSDTGKEVETQFSTDMLGTLIAWRVPVEAANGTGA